MKKIRWISHSDLLCLLFLTGSIAGCVTANLLSVELLRQIGYFDSVYQWGSSIGREEKGQLWRYLAKRRFLEFGAGSLVGMTPFSSAAFCCVMFVFGFSAALLISVFTLQSGWLGMVYFLRTILPQWGLYGMVWGILAIGAENGLDKMKIRVWPLLILVVFLGTFLETKFV
jgi:hypothetical protein